MGRVVSVRWSTLRLEASAESWKRFGEVIAAPDWKLTMHIDKPVTIDGQYPCSADVRRGFGGERYAMWAMYMVCRSQEQKHKYHQVGDEEGNIICVSYTVC